MKKIVLAVIFVPGRLAFSDCVCFGRKQQDRGKTQDWG